MHSSSARWSLLATLAAILAPVALTGCGSSHEATEDWEAVPAVSPAARLEYKVDSLSNENRRMRDQVNALAAENRNLTAKNAELETKLTEALATQKEAPAAVTAGTSPADHRAGYDAALALVKQRNYAEAVTRFDALLTGGIEGDYEDNCRYWIGEAYYGMGKYREALDSFEKVLKYKKSEKKNDARLMIATTYAAMGNKEAARKAYEDVLAARPQPYIAKKAQERLARLK